MFNRKFLALILIAFSMNAKAEWILVDVAENGMRAYVDYSTHRNGGGSHKIKRWELYDYKSPKKFGRNVVSSTVELAQYDCINETMQILSLVGYSKHMGNGNVLISETYGEYAPSTPAVPNSIGRTMWEIACNK